MVVVFNDFVCTRNIRYLREKYKVSRRALSRLVGISVLTLRDFEEERVLPFFTHRQLKRIIDVFELPIEQFTQQDLLNGESDGMCGMKTPSPIG